MINSLSGNIQISPIASEYKSGQLFNPRFANFLKGTANTLNNITLTPKGILKTPTQNFPEDTKPKVYVKSVKSTIGGKPTSFNGDGLQVKNQIPKDMADLRRFVKDAPPKSISGMRDEYEARLKHKTLAEHIKNSNDFEKIRAIQMKQQNNSITGDPTTSKNSPSDLHKVNEKFNKVYGGDQVVKALKKQGRL